MLASVQHQEVHLVVNPGKAKLRGWTEVTAAAPPAGEVSIGLHSKGQNIISVSVNGVPVEFNLRQSPAPGLAQPADGGEHELKDVAEQAYYDYLSAVQQEMLPDLTIQLPPGWDGSDKPDAAPQPGAEPGMDAVPGAAEPNGATPAHQPPDGGAGAGNCTNPASPAQATPGVVAAAGAGATSADPGQNAALMGGVEVTNQPGAPHPPSDLPPVHTNGHQAALASPNGAAAPQQPAPGAAPDEGPPRPPLHIRVEFSASLDARSNSAVMLLPGDDLADSCEAPLGSPADRYLVTDSQHRRTCALFPCADVAGVVSPYKVHITVPPTHMAVCDGALQSQHVSYLSLPDGTQVPHARTFVYASELPVNPSQLMIATGPLVATPLVRHNKPGEGGAARKPAATSLGADGVTCALTCFAPPQYSELAAYTCRALHLILGVYQKHLGSRIPFTQLHVAFVPAAAFGARDPPAAVGSNLIMLSTRVLVGPDALEPAVESTLLLAQSVARCLFGGVLLPLAPEDTWVSDGLAAHLTEQWVLHWLGKNELAWRRHKERLAVAQADNGGGPPLCSRSPARPAPPVPAPGGASAAPAVLPSDRAFGFPFGTELLEPVQLRRWKAAAVIRMLERRVGEDQFKRHLGSLVAKVVAHSTSAKFRFVSTHKFLRVMSKQSGGKSTDPFAARWVYGRGCPELELGVLYRKNNTLDMALRQGGSAASLRAAKLAVKASKQPGGEDDTLASVKVVVHEAEGSRETRLKLEPPDTDLVQGPTLELTTKVVVKRPTSRKPRKGEAPKEEPKDEGGEGADGTGADGPKIPVFWVRLDPGGDWLAVPRVRQPESGWVAQLEQSRDVVGQALAVPGLIKAGSLSPGAVAALSAAVRNPAMFCRVRAEAALALGVTATAEEALPILSNYLHAALHDPVTLVLRPNVFADLSEHVLLSALPVALGQLRGQGDASPPEALDALLEFLECQDNALNPYSCAWYVACYVEGLGHCQPGTKDHLMRVLAALDRQLALEDLSPSPHFTVGCAALTALHRLASRSVEEEVWGRVLQLLTRYAGPGVPLPLRTAAARLLMRHVATRYDEPAAGVLEILFELHDQPGWGAAGRAGLLLDAFTVLGELLADGVPRPGRPALAGRVDPEADREREEEISYKLQELTERTTVSVAAALRLYHLMHACKGARERQLAFMLLQRVARQDPTLYREREEEIAEANAPLVAPEPTVVRSMDAAPTGAKTAVPAASGGTGVTVAGATAGTAAAARAEPGSGQKKLGVRLKLTAAQLAAATAAAAGGAVPTTSQGTHQGPAASGPARSDVSRPQPSMSTLSMQAPAAGAVAIKPSASALPARSMGPVSGLPAASAPLQSIPEAAADGEVVQPLRSAAPAAPAAPATAVVPVKPEPGGPVLEADSRTVTVTKQAAGLPTPAPDTSAPPAAATIPATVPESTVPTAAAAVEQTPVGAGSLAPAAAPAAAVAQQPVAAQSAPSSTAGPAEGAAVQPGPGGAVPAAAGRPDGTQAPPGSRVRAAFGSGPRRRSGSTPPATPAGSAGAPPALAPQPHPAPQQHPAQAVAPAAGAVPAARQPTGSLGGGGASSAVPPPRPSVDGSVSGGPSHDTTPHVPPGGTAPGLESPPAPTTTTLPSQPPTIPAQPLPPSAAPAGAPRPAKFKLKRPQGGAGPPPTAVAWAVAPTGAVGLPQPAAGLPQPALLPQPTAVSPAQPITSVAAPAQPVMPPAASAYVLPAVGAPPLASHPSHPSSLPSHASGAKPSVSQGYRGPTPAPPTGTAVPYPPSVPDPAGPSPFAAAAQLPAEPVAPARTGVKVIIKFGRGGVPRAPAGLPPQVPGPAPMHTPGYAYDPAAAYGHPPLPPTAPYYGGAAHPQLPLGVQPSLHSVAASTPVLPPAAGFGGDGAVPPAPPVASGNKLRIRVKNGSGGGTDNTAPQSGGGPQPPHKRSRQQ